jgi:hypothetical protein
VTYLDLADCLAERSGIDRRLIAPTTATEKGVNILFKPRFSGIGMRRTTELTGLAPQSLRNAVDDLVAMRGG